MALTINTNIASLNAQRNLTASQSALATSLQRLSSGLRINSAKDDAAGLAISERFTSQIRGITQAARNANDGISLSQTAEGDLTQVSNNLQRIRELAVQSANSTNSSSDRAAIQSETSQLVAEIDRVAQNSKFNGVNLLDGTFSNQQFQVGANAGETINVAGIASARTTALGASYSASVVGSNVSGVASNGANVTLNGVNVIASVSDGVSSVGASGSAKALATAINGTSGANATATASTSVAGVDNTGALADGTGTITINGVTTATITQAAASSVTVNQDAMAFAINQISAATGVIATATHGAGGVTLAASDGRNVDVGAYTQASGSFTSATTGVAAVATNHGKLSFSSSGTSGLTFGGTVAILGTPTNTAATQSGTAIAAIDLSTLAGANAAIASIDSALASVNASRASLGAYQNRFSSVVTSLQTTSENLSASRSRIQDTDYAAETASMTRGQIMQQAGTAMLAQANQLPNMVLTLLK
jgi:flagellin